MLPRSLTSAATEIRVVTDYQIPNAQLRHVSRNVGMPRWPHRKHIYVTGINLSNPQVYNSGDVGADLSDASNDVWI